MKIKSVFLLSILLVLFTSCQKKNQADSASLEAIEEMDRLYESFTNVKQEDGSILDYDLTKMNANMVYAQIFELMLNPEEYKDKVFKINGTFMISPDQEGKDAYAVLIKDALACCQQGLEFKYDFGQDVPLVGTEMTITGKYVLTEKDGISHNYLVANKIEF